MVTKRKFWLYTRIALWVICAFFIWSLVSNLLSLPSSTSVATGVIILVAFIALSVATTCFTRFRWKTEYEERREARKRQREKNKHV